MAGRAVSGGEARSAEIAARCGASVNDRSGGAGKMMRAVKRRTGKNKQEVSPSKKVELARALSKLGYCSRSRAAELIVAGRVKLNGAVRRDPQTPVRLGKDRIEIEGQPIEGRSRIYLALNKPRGVVTTASDEKDRETVYAYLPEGLTWIAPVGRLDKASEGLLLLTNDSEWAARVLAPESHLDRTYHVQIAGAADPSFCKALIRGFQSASGYAFRMKQAHILR